MFIVEWTDYEGNLQQRPFEDRESAELEAASLEERFDTFSYSTPEEFDRYISRYPPMKGHVLTLFDSWTSTDCFGLCRKIVREITGI